MCLEGLFGRTGNTGQPVLDVDVDLRKRRRLAAPASEETQAWRDGGRDHEQELPSP